MPPAVRLSPLPSPGPARPADAVPPDALRRILIIAPQLLGDAVLSSVLITALKDLQCDCRIDVLVHAPLADVFRHHPGVAEVFLVDPAWRQKGLWATIRPRQALIRRLRARGYDLLIQSPHTTDGSWGPALIALLPIPYAVGAAATVHGSPLKRVLWRRLFSHTLPAPGPYQAPRHVAELHLDLLRRIGLKPRAAGRAAHLEPGPGARDAIAAWLAARGLAPGRFVLFAPTAGQAGRTLPVALCRAFLDHCEHTGWAVAVTSGPGARERAFVEALCAGRGPLTHALAGTLTIAELAALTAAARVFIGSDSGPLHVAAAMGVPVLACFGPGAERRFGPWQVRYRLLTSGHSCRPCELDGCGQSGRADCLEALAPDDLITAFHALGGDDPAATPAPGA